MLHAPACLAYTSIFIFQNHILVLPAIVVLALSATSEVLPRSICTGSRSGVSHFCLPIYPFFSCFGSVSHFM